MIKLSIVILFFLGIGSSQAQSTGKWGDQGDGIYANPILPSDYSDIDAIRVGSDYYAISSTFQYSPGMVVLHSTDLVNWRILSHVIDDVTQIGPALNWDKMDRYGRAVWAGAIRYHENKYWIYFGTPDEGIFMTTAEHPAGPWEPLHKMWGVAGWNDTCPFWDDDGQGYLVTTNFSDNYKIHLFKMSADGKHLLMETDSVIHQSPGSEANKFYKINGRYYHYYSEVKPEGRVIMMGRSKNIYGPYEHRQLNHVDKKRDKEPNQGGLIQIPSGEWWFLTHQGTGDWEGRAACLLPVTWIKDWPIIGAVGQDTIGNMIWTHKKPIAGSAILRPQTNDEFDKKQLAVQWEWNYQPRKENWSLTERDGFLRLKAFKPLPLKDNSDKRKLLYRVGNTLTQRCMRTNKNEVVVKIEIGNMADGQSAGICHYAKTYSILGVRQEKTIRRIVYDNNGTETAGPLVAGTTVWLKSTWGLDGLSKYAYSVDGKKFVDIGDAYQLSWGFYRGDRIGIHTYNLLEENGLIDVDWFHYDYVTR